MQRESVAQINELFHRSEFGETVSEHLLQNQGFIKPLVHHMRSSVATEIESAKLVDARIEK